MLFVSTVLGERSSESAWGSVEAIREKVIEETERALLSGNVRNFVEHIYKCFLSVLS